MFAKVIVDIRHEEVNQTYDYIIPKACEGFLVRGMRVLVPFGAQKRLGFVIEMTDHSDEATKEILEVLDAVPTVDDELFYLMDDIEKEAPNHMSRLFHTVVPSELFVQYSKEAHALDMDKIPEDLKCYFSSKGIWKLKQKDQNLYPRLKRLSDQKIISFKTVIKQKASAKTVSAYRYNPNHTYPKAKGYQHILDVFKDHQSITRAHLLEHGASVSHISTLLKHAVLLADVQEVKRDIQHQFDLKDKQVILTLEQQLAYQSIKDHLNQQQTSLLKGVTGSGKTEIYLALIKDVLSAGKQVLFLVPEITLIAPTAMRLKSRFDHVAIYHSGLSKGERYDQYRMLLTQEAQILLGTRSACFMPLENLGLIIIDEEHDTAYEQTEGVIYDARTVAQARSRYHNIPLVLGSATPQVVSMYLAEKKTYQLLELTERPHQIQMPLIDFIDMKQELKDKHTSIFSRTLLQAMKDRLDRKEQSMLLFNRKGYAPFVLCRHCGDVPQCPHCDISLTYYKDKSHLKCHYCGFEKPFNKTCEVCHEDKVKEMGVGIEYVESILKKELPQARIIRMDQNSTRTKGSHELLWHQFQSESADILLGTQMIAKGLDFPKVTLVGVLMADLLLRVPSYRADEQAYMLLSQVTGRSGRSLPGQAIIQAYDLNHYAIRAVKEGYETFYKQALSNRKLLGYQPFKKTSQILIEGPSFLQTYQQAFMLKKRLTEKDATVLGPTEALIRRIKDRYRFVITLKYEKLNAQDIQSLIKIHEKEHISIRYYPTLDIV